MPKQQILQDTQVVDDAWVYLDDDASAPDEASDLLISLERFTREGTKLEQAGHRVGVRFSPQHTGRELGEDLHGRPLVAVDFPKFTDGRGYTIASRLRTQLGYRGRLRATGDVLPDQVFYMQRCGFDQLHLRADKAIEDALAALTTFSVRYQGDAADPRPLYRRRA